MKLSEQANMPHLNIILDVGAAINAYKFIWNDHVQYRNVYIHLGMFHFMRENFKVLHIAKMRQKFQSEFLNSKIGFL